MDFTLEAVNFAEDGISINKAAQKYSWDRKGIREWQQAKTVDEKQLIKKLKKMILEWFHQRHRSYGHRVQKQ